MGKFRMPPELEPHVSQCPGLFNNHNVKETPEYVGIFASLLWGWCLSLAAILGYCSELPLISLVLLT